MEAVEALHAAARRYCVDRAAEWDRRYSELRLEEERERRLAGVPEPAAYTYSPEALATFPRYHVLHAIQASVESFVPDELGPIDEARELLAEAGATADNLFTNDTGDIEQRAIDEERDLFGHYVRSITDEALARVEPLPFRRTLAREESATLWHELRNRAWTATNSADFDADPFFEPELQQRLREVLSNLGVERVWELRELDTDPDTEIALELLEPVYTGAEGYWLDESFDWLIYASHEDFVTVAGLRLLPALKAAWPTWNEHLYGPLH